MTYRLRVRDMDPDCRRWSWWIVYVRCLRDGCWTPTEPGTKTKDITQPCAVTTNQYGTNLLSSCYTGLQRTLFQIMWIRYVFIGGNGKGHQTCCQLRRIYWLTVLRSIFGSRIDKYVPKPFLAISVSASSVCHVTSQFASPEISPVCRWLSIIDRTMLYSVVSQVLRCQCRINLSPSCRPTDQSWKHLPVFHLERSASVSETKRRSSTTVRDSDDDDNDFEVCRL